MAGLCRVKKLCHIFSGGMTLGGWRAWRVHAGTMMGKWRDHAGMMLGICPPHVRLVDIMAGSCWDDVGHLPAMSLFGQLYGGFMSEMAGLWRDEGGLLPAKYSCVQSKQETLVSHNAPFCFKSWREAAILK